MVCITSDQQEPDVEAQLFELTFPCYKFCVSFVQGLILENSI